MAIKVEVDWAKDGYSVTPYDLYSETYSELYAVGLASATGYTDDVTTRVRPQIGGVSAQYGRDQSTALAPTVAGRGSFTLDNSDRRFSSRNTASPLYGLIKPARPVRISRTVAGVGGYVDPYVDGYDTPGTFTLFVGHTDDNPINPDISSKTVSVSLVDSLADFRGLTISTSLHAGTYTGEAIGYVLDACNWTGGRHLDRGATVMPWWWEEGTDALTAMETLIRCEGPPALLTVDVDGGIVFRDRHHRLLDSRSYASQGVWRGKGSLEPVMSLPFAYDEAWRNIINTGRVSVDVRTPRTEEPVWNLDSTIGLSASEIKTITVATSDPFRNAVAPVAGTDYILISGSVSIALSRTSGASTTLTLTAGGSGAQLSGLQLRAQPVQTAYTVQVSATDQASVDDYGPRSFPGDLNFCGQWDAQAVLDTTVAMHAQPLPIVNARFVLGVNQTRAARILERNLSDRVTVVEDETVLNDDFYIESFQHDFAGEQDHAVTVGLEAVPPDGAATAANLFLVGSTAAAHNIGAGVLAN